MLIKPFFEGRFNSKISMDSRNFSYDFCNSAQVTLIIQGKIMVHKQMEKEELYYLYNTINTASFFTNQLQNYAFNFKQPFKFIDIYQSPDTTIDGLDWHSIFFFNAMENYILQTPCGKDKGVNQNHHFEETSEVQLAIGSFSVGVHTKALCCKCLKLCSMLTCTISASIFFAFPD